VVGLRDSGLTYEAIAAQVGLTRTAVFNICRRFAEQGLAGLASGPRGPAPGTGRYCQVGHSSGLWQGLGHEHDIQSLPRLPLSGRNHQTSGVVVSLLQPEPAGGRIDPGRSRHRGQLRDDP
jgi:hypothetical protein